MRISDASTGNKPDTSKRGFTIAAPSILPPLNPALDTALNTARDRKTNSLAWAANPENAGVTVANYKIYRKPASAADSAFVVMASVAGTATQYADPDLDILTKYAYRVTAVSSLGGESIPSATVIETKKFEFAPVGVSVTTIVNRVLFNQIKENTVLFSPSPYNPEADVAGYDVYRRKASEGDTALAFIKSFGCGDVQLQGCRPQGRAKIRLRAEDAVYGRPRERLFEGRFGEVSREIPATDNPDTRAVCGYRASRSTRRRFFS